MFSYNLNTLYKCNGASRVTKTNMNKKSFKIKNAKIIFKIRPTKKFH